MWQVMHGFFSFFVYSALPYEVVVDTIRPPATTRAGIMNRISFMEPPHLIKAIRRPHANLLTMLSFYILSRLPSHLPIGAKRCFSPDCAVRIAPYAPFI